MRSPDESYQRSAISYQLSEVPLPAAREPALIVGQLIADT